MTGRLRRWWTARDTGSYSMWAAVLGLVLIVAAGFAYDQATKIRAVRDAQTSAQEAARAGAQHVAAAAIDGQHVTIDPAAAAAAARNYLRLTGATGTVTVTGHTLTVTTTRTWTPQILSAVGVTAQTMRGTATIDLRTQ